VRRRRRRNGKRGRRSIQRVDIDDGGVNKTTKGVVVSCRLFRFRCRSVSLCDGVGGDTIAAAQPAAHVRVYYTHLFVAQITGASITAAEAAHHAPKHANAGVQVRVVHSETLAVFIVKQRRLKTLVRHHLVADAVVEVHSHGVDDANALYPMRTVLRCCGA
jgi:hypothetical protein